MSKPRIAVMASGEGTNYSALMAASRRGDLRADIVGVVTDTRNAGVVDRALSDNLNVFIATEETVQESLRSGLHFFEPDLVALAGLNRILQPSTVDDFRGRIINTHSAPLPEFGGPGMYGRKLREAVLESGRTESEITVHVVDYEVDRGRILGVSDSFPILEGDTVEIFQERLLAVENDFYWRVIDQYLEELGLV